MTSRTWLIVAGLTVLAFAAAWLIPAMPQALAYHDFADHRGALGMQNFFDVASNGAFFVVGLVGLVVRSPAARGSSSMSSAGRTSSSSSECC